MVTLNCSVEQSFCCQSLESICGSVFNELILLSESRRWMTVVELSDLIRTLLGLLDRRVCRTIGSSEEEFDSSENTAPTNRALIPAETRTSKRGRISEGDVTRAPMPGSSSGRYRNEFSSTGGRGGASDHRNTIVSSAPFHD